MLQSVLMISSAGLVIFSKQFTGTLNQPRLVGSLIRALVKFSTHTTGKPLSYIDLASVSVTIAGDPSGPVFCALLFDRFDTDLAGPEFGSLLANHLLMCFLEDYGDEVVSAGGHNLKEFQGFQYRLPRAVRDVSRQVLGFLQSLSAVVSCSLITDDAMIESLAEGPASEVDEVAVLAIVRPLLGAARDMLAVLGDTPEFLTLDGDTVSGTRVLLWRLDSGTLVLRVKIAASHAKIMEDIDRPLNLIRRLCALLGHLRGGLTGGAAASTGVGVGAVVGED